MDLDFLLKYFNITIQQKKSKIKLILNNTSILSEVSILKILALSTKERKLFATEEWNEISKRNSFSNEFLKLFENHINFSILSLFIDFSLFSENDAILFLNEWEDKIDWRCIGKNKSVNEKLIEPFLYHFKKGDLHSSFFPIEFILEHCELFTENTLRASGKVTSSKCEEHSLAIVKGEHSPSSNLCARESLTHSKKIKRDIFTPLFIFLNLEKPKIYKRSKFELIESLLF